MHGQLRGGVKALTFMAKLALKDKVVEDNFTTYDRIHGHPLFYAGKIGYVMIGAWVDSAMKQAGATFPVTYADIPSFAGQKQAGLIITDSIAFFTKAKNLKAAGKFIDFFYQDAVEGQVRPAHRVPARDAERGQGSVLEHPALQGPQPCGAHRAAVAAGGRVRHAQPRDVEGV